MSAAAEATHDVAVIGAGIVGLATAKALLARWPQLRVCVLEKDAAIRRAADLAQQRRDPLRHLLPARLAQG